MSDRERLMAIGIGCIVALLMLFGGYRMVKGGFDKKNETLSDRLSTLRQKKAVLTQAKRDRMLVAEYKRKSLHEDPRAAHPDFIHWLEKQLNQSGLREPRVSFDSIPRTKKTMKQLSYQVNGVGDITQITDLLHRVHSADTLHRVRSINMQKQKDGIHLSARVDALSLPKIEGEKVAIGTVNEAKVTKSLDEYNEAIANRNLFSPANLPPKFGKIRTESVELGDRLSVKLEATDPEDAGVVFELDDTAPAWMEITKSGKLSGKPKELGEYEFTVYVVDKGIPAKESTSKMTVKVVPEKVVEKRPEKKPEEFDGSKLAVLTAIVQGASDPLPQMCMYLRDKDESQYLQEGDKLKIGNWRGSVVFVDPDRNTVLLQKDDGEFELRLGDALSDARRVGKKKTVELEKEVEGDTL